MFETDLPGGAANVFSVYMSVHATASDCVSVPPFGVLATISTHLYGIILDLFFPESHHFAWIPTTCVCVCVYSILWQGAHSPVFASLRLMTHPRS